MTTAAAAELFDPQLLRTLRAAPWRTIERRFLFILAASIGLHLAFASYLAAQPMPVDLTLDEVDPGFHPATPQLPPLHPIPKIPNLPVTAKAPAPAQPASPAPKVDRVKIARLGVLGVINADGPDSAFKGLLDSSSTEIAEALRDAKGVNTVVSADPTQKGGKTGEVATVARLGTDGVKQVGLGTRVETRPSRPADGPIVLEKTTDIDPRVLQQFIAARRAAVQNCYERALLHNPTLQGKVVLRLAVGAGGRVSDLDIEEDTLGSEAVTACMSTLVRRWVFPVAPKEELPVSVPFIFARAN